MPLVPANLTPAEQAEFDHLSAAPDATSNGLPPGAKPFDPVNSLDATGLAELADHKLFDPVQWATENSSAALDPANLQKLADANAIIRQKGFQLKDLPSPVEAAGGVFGAVKGALKVARNIGSIATAPLVSLAGDITGQGPEFGAAIADIATKQAGESVAGIEQAGKGLVDIGTKAGGKLIRKTFGTNYGEMTPEQRKDAFLADLGNAQVSQQVATGQGPFTQAVAGQFISELKQQGVELDPKEIADLSAGDPISFVAFGGGFKLLGKAGQVLGTAVDLGAAQKAVSALMQREAGGVFQEAAGAATTAGKTKVLAPLLPATGAVGGFLKTGGLGGAYAGEKAGAAVAKTLEKAAPTALKAGEQISQFGKQVAGESAVTSPYAQAIRDAIKVAPPAVAELAKGAGLDIGLAAASSETPQETQATSAFGTLFGALGAARHLATTGIRTGVQGQLLTPRPWGTAAESKPYGTNAFLDAEHARAQQTLSADVTQRANSVREFLRSVPGDVQAYLMPDKAATETFLVDDYTKRNGVAPTGDALVKIKNAADQRGMINYDALADDGSQKRIVLLNDVEAAPHEAFHGIQDVLGDSGNKAIDRIVFDAYHDRWESIGENYANRLVPGDTRPWREVVKDSTNTDNPDQYLAREIAAENFDIVFKNLGASLKEGNSLPQKLARVVAETMHLFGAEPFAGGQTAGLKLEPNFGISEEVKNLVSGIAEQKPATSAAPTGPLVTPKPAPVKPTIPSIPAAPKTPAVPTSSAVGVSPDAKAAQAWAAGKSDPRLVNIVNSIVANQVKSAPGEAAPVRLKYLSVTGEDAATRTPRRSEQEAAYLAEALGAMPAETRQEVEKTHAHVRFDPVKKGNEMQSIGYSLEKLIENAQRAAKWLAGNDAARPISPYEIDTATGSFTPDAWKQLVSDIQAYTVNQQAGGTGAGKALVLPQDAAAKLGVSVPPIQAAKFAPLEQNKADFINALMGFKLPETTRVSRNGGTPGNIVGQEISKANEQPFIQPRISAPAVERGGGKEFAGFPGRTIQEVNPLRRQLEAAGFPVGELTEVVERVNLKHLESVTPAPEVNFRPGVTDTIRAGFLPAETEADQVEKLTQQELQGWSAGQKGGYTATAHRVGQEAPNQAFVDSLKVRADRFKKEALDGMQNDNFDAAMTSSTKAQFFREAWEAATGTGSAGERLSKVDPNYKPRFSAESNSPIGQFLPNGEKVEKAAIILHDGKMFTGSFHGAAFRAAQEAGAIPAGESVSSLIPVYVKDEGFVTNKGTYLTRKEAADLAIANQQAKPGTANHMLASRGRLEAHTFQEERSFLPNAEVKDVADKYAKSAGFEPVTFQMKPVSEALGKKLADFYDEAKHSPNDPAVQKSYQALADETLAQYKAMTDAGYTIEPFEGKGEPYKNSAEMAADVQDNKHLYFLRTEGNFSGENNPMLEPSGVKINGAELPVNDVFRAVHDFFGHATEGLQFGPKGEFNAWRVHSEMYSPEAQGALAAETLAQNSFVNFGKHLRDKAGNIPAKGEPGYVALPDRRFAEQKNVVVPADLINEAKSQFSPKANEDPYAKYNEAYDKAVAKRKAAGGKSGLTGWILPNNKFTPLESNYHEQYLAENSASLNKKFGTKFSETPDVEERQQALDKGFVRLRMQGGTLHIESGQAGWTKAARDKVFETVADNLDRIDQIQISLLDKNGIVKRQGYERLLDFETDAEKLDNIPLISGAK